MRVEHSNVQSPLRWSLLAASREFPHSDVTIASRLADLGEQPDADGLWTTQQLYGALIGGALPAERLKKLRAETAKTELETAILRGDYLNRRELENVFAQITDGVLQIIKTSKLTLEEQNDLRRQLSSIPVVIRHAARSQTRHSRNATNGNGSRPARARSKRKSPRGKTGSGAG